MSRKSRTVMFRSMDVLVVLVETRITISVKLYLKLKYIAQCGDDSMRERFRESFRACGGDSGRSR
jgi:hypothetical protein